MFSKSKEETVFSSEDGHSTVLVCITLQEVEEEKNNNKGRRGWREPSSVPPFQVGYAPVHSDEPVAGERRPFSIPLR